MVNLFELGFVWIELILLKLKTENWKHCNKIIFKCVNSAMGPIFNEKIDKKWNLWIREQCTDALFTKDRLKVVATIHVPYMNSTTCWGKRREKKKKKGKRRNLKRSKRGSKLCLSGLENSWLTRWWCVSEFFLFDVEFYLFILKCLHGFF